MNFIKIKHSCENHHDFLLFLESRSRTEKLQVDLLFGGVHVKIIHVFVLIQIKQNYYKWIIIFLVFLVISFARENIVEQTRAALWRELRP